MTLKSGLEITQDHSNWYHSNLGAVSYSPSIVTMAYLASFPGQSEILVENRDFFDIPLHSTGVSV